MFKVNIFVKVVRTQTSRFTFLFFTLHMYTLEAAPLQNCHDFLKFNLKIDYIFKKLSFSLDVVALVELCECKDSSWRVLTGKESSDDTTVHALFFGFPVNGWPNRDVFSL